MGFFPRPVKPSAAWADLRAFLRDAPKHKIGMAVASIAIPLFFIALFYLDQVPEEYRPPEITYVTSWEAGRTDAEIKKQQKIDRVAREAEEKRVNAELEKNRKPFKQIDKKLDEWGL